MLILTALPAAAADCGNGLPCGPVPWNLPALPALKSPTPMPTFFFTATFTPTITPTNFTPSPTASATFTPSNTPTPSATSTPTNAPSPTFIFNIGEVGSINATIEALINATPFSIEISGTPVTVNDQINGLSGEIEDFFGRVKGILQAEWGVYSPPLNAFVLSVAIVFFVVVITYSIPVIGLLIGMVRKIWEIIGTLIELIMNVISMFKGG